MVDGLIQKYAMERYKKIIIIKIEFSLVIIFISQKLRRGSLSHSYTCTLKFVYNLMRMSAIQSDPTLFKPNNYSNLTISDTTTYSLLVKSISLPKQIRNVVSSKVSILPALKNFTLFLFLMAEIF